MFLLSAFHFQLECGNRQGFRNGQVRKGRREVIHCMRDVGVIAGRSRSVQSTAAPSRSVRFLLILFTDFITNIL